MDASKDTDRDGDRDGDRDDQVLRERAAALARAGRKGDAAPTRLALAFVREGRCYAVDARATCGVQVLHELMELGDVPKPLVGYTVFRGEPLALFDPARVLSGNTSAPPEGEADAGAAAARRQFAVVLGTERPRLGLLADEVDQVAPLDAALFEPAGHPDPLLLGTGPSVQVLDAPGLIRNPRFLIDQSE